MNSPSTSLDPGLFTTFPTWEEELDCEILVIAPEERECPSCSTGLKLYKTISSRYVRTLRSIKQIKEIQTYCPNRECPGREWDSVAKRHKARLFKSSKLRQLVLPHKQYGLDVLLEIGRLTYEERKTGMEVRHDLIRRFALPISLGTIYRYRDLFEALSVGVTYDHHKEIARKLHKQPVFIVIFDAMQFGGGQKLYRAIDFLSGFCLGALVAYEGGKERLKQWRQELFTLFGTPDYIVSDGEAALHLDHEEESEIPHQDCWYHVEQNIWDALFQDWRTDARLFLQKTAYRAQLKNILRTLSPIEDINEPQPLRHLRTVLEVLVTPPPRGNGFGDRVAVRLYQLREALTLVNQWVRALKGKRDRPSVPLAPFREYQALKKHLALGKYAPYLQHEIFVGTSWIRTLLALQKLLDPICRAKTFNTLLLEYKSRYNEFECLRSWLLEAILRRNDVTPRHLIDPQTVNGNRLIRVVNRMAVRANKELALISPKYRAWKWDKREPDLPLRDKGHRALSRIIARWTKKGHLEVGFTKAAAILSRQLDNLLTFFDHVAIPVSNQAIETDNGRLKQFWRRLTGGQDRLYTLVYHGVGTSMTLNYFKQGILESPLELLGFKTETIDCWYHACSPEQLTTQIHYLDVVRKPRKLLLQAKHQSLAQILKDAYKDWITYGINQVSQYLNKKGS